MISKDEGLGATLKALRKWKKFSLSLFSDLTGLSKSYTSEVENGKKQISLKVIRLYSEYTEVPVSVIFLIHEKVTNTDISISDVSISEIRGMADKELAKRSLREHLS